MDVQGLKTCLTKLERRELGIPVILPSFADAIFPIASWALEGTALDARQVWFCVGNAKEIQSQLSDTLRNRILPLPPFTLEAIIQRGPFDALLLPDHGFFYSDPNLTLSSFWTSKGSYQKHLEWSFPGLSLWTWLPKNPPIRLFSLDHHHAVQWDLRQSLRPFGITVDFHWLCDGRPSVNEALPSEIPHFRSSLDLYKPPLSQSCSDEFKAYLKEKGYKGILTSHSLVTWYRLKDLDLPCFHINSTRFGNEWIQTPERHEALVAALKDHLTQGKLRILHNNKGDQEYFHQYVPTVPPQQELTLPSLCESLLRLRIQPPTPAKILLWDTRQLLLQPDGSPFLKELYTKCKQAFGESLDAQSLLMAERQGYLPEGYLDSYSAVIHIPYNISTMSMFQQVRANIPIWVPSKALLAKLWADPKEPNELSWTVFAPGSEANASTLDSVRNPSVIDKWIQLADFYDPTILPLCYQFDSSEDLIQRAFTTDYAAAIKHHEAKQQERRESHAFALEAWIRGGLGCHPL